MTLPASTPLAFRPRTQPVKRAISKEEAEEIRFAFETLQSGHDSTGHVTQKQLKVALRAMGFPVKKADVLELLRRQGEEESSLISFNVFSKVVSEKLSERSPAEDMRRAFALFDVHGLGKIDLPTLRKVVKSLGLEIADAELEDMIHEFDTDNDGMINENEFMSIMLANED